MTLLLAIGALFALAILLVLFRDLGFGKGIKTGMEQGYERGRKDADNWWMGIETETDRMRLKLWRQEGEKKFEEWP